MSHPPRLALVVAPRLLGDTLARVLRNEGIEVVIAERGAALDEQVDVAVISGDISVAVHAPVVVTLPGDDDRGIGSIQRHGAAAEALDLPDIQALVRTLRMEGERALDGGGLDLGSPTR